MNANELQSSMQTDGSLSFQPLTMIVAAWDGDRVTPGGKHYLGVTITNRGEQDAVVQVRLESTSALLLDWCAQPEQWLALSSHRSGELTFCVEIPGDAVPQWLDYEVVARPQGAYADYFLSPNQRRLQILAPETTESTQDPTFSLTPFTTPDRPVVVQGGEPLLVELIVENRSERVDRFRVECTGFPADWPVQIEYPREFGGLGLVRQDDSIGINPSDRGRVQVTIQPPALPLAGNYLPTFRLLSENNPTLGVLGLVYLRVVPVYQLQSQLLPPQEQVRDRPVEFNLQFTNLGNTDRQIEIGLTPLKQPGPCEYALPTHTVTLPPQSVARLPLRAMPQRWWLRPWLGGGKVYPFRLDFVDRDRQPITPDTLPGQLTWLPRPWWQLLLVALAGLGLLGTLAFLLWWLFLRPPTPPQLLEFAAEDSKYAELNGDMARVRWQIERPDQIQRLKLVGYSPEGEILSGPLVYEFVNGQLPPALEPFCKQQKTLLTCNQVRTDAFLPGKYIFELTLTGRGRQAASTSLKSAPVEITAKPVPTVTALVPKSLFYREAAPGQPTPAEQAIPIADQAGVRLDWAVTMPQDIAALRLTGRDQDGKMIGDRWYELPAAGQLPEALRPYCSLGPTLICRNVPTGLRAVGEYRFELRAVAIADAAKGNPQADPNVKPITTETIKILPQTPQLLSFQINGREAPAKVLIPLRQGQAPPLVQVSWRVQGGSTTRVALLPSPGHVPLTGRVNFPLSPTGNTTLTLQVKSATGEPLTRSITLEVFNPNPPDPTAAITQAIKSAAQQRSAPTASPSPSPSPAPSPGASPPTDAAPFGVPSPTVPNRLSPSEQPPQFNN
ncbi:MAG: hypothetical protein NW220_02620 [Leptolyngbyaceae cyanobacterium bins.349]|nr:hypothetical protein [Leptolyngbyaceae cyanobacterium bins.349]